MTRSRIALFAAIGGLALVAAVGIGVRDIIGGAHRQSSTSGTAAIGGPFTLVDDDGATVTQASLAGKPSVLYFGYTFCPETCPTTLADLTRWIHKLGPDAGKLNYVFITVDPQRDTPKVLHEYLSSFDKRIRGFTGTPAQIAQMAKEYKVYYQKIPTKGVGYLMDHSAMIYLMRADGKFAGIIPYQEKDDVAVAKLEKLTTGPRDSPE